MELVSQSHSWERQWQDSDRRFHRDLNELKIRLELNNLQETEGIIEYHSNFEQISSRQTLPEDYLVRSFLAGLRSDTQSTVRMFQPHIVRQCFLIGKLYKSVHPRERSVVTGASEFKNSTSSQPNQKILYSPSNGFSGANSTSFSATTESPIDLERKRCTSADLAASLLAAITNIQPAATMAAMTSDHSPLVAVNQRNMQQPSAESKVREDFCLSQEETKTQGSILGMDPDLRVCRKWSATEVESLTNDLMATDVESLENAWGSGKRHSVASLGILYAHQVFDQMLGRVLTFFDTTIDIEFTLGTVWVLFAIYAPFDKGKIKLSGGFGNVLWDDFLGSALLGGDKCSDHEGKLYSVVVNREEVV